MYVLNDFDRALRLFIHDHAALDVDIKLSTDRQRFNGHVRFYSAKHLQYLVEKLTDEFTTVERCSYCSNYMSIWLKKELWTSAVVRQILDMGCRYGRNEELKGTVISVSADECNDTVTNLRIVLLRNVVENLAEINGCDIGNNGLDLLVSKKNNSKNTSLILCGSVICNVTIDQYKEQKQNIITKMSASRIETDEYPIDIVSKLCHTSIIYELLSVRHNKVVRTECINTLTKDNGIFIMYNYSRLCQIWTAYEKGVANNCYKPLPDINAVNFGLLTSEEEWLLVFNHLSVCPSVIRESVRYLKSASVDVHRLCKFLMEMSSTISLFYHRHRVLSDPISSLLPLMYARLYLVRASIRVYENVFRLLGVQAVCEM